MTQDDKFKFSMSFGLDKLTGAPVEWQPWNLTNDYNGLDYGQVVGLQAILMKTMTEIFTMLGVQQAEAMGFDMSALKAQLSGMVETAKEDKKASGKMVGEAR